MSDESKTVLPEAAAVEEAVSDSADSPDAEALASDDESFAEESLELEERLSDAVLADSEDAVAVTVVEEAVSDAVD
jgi:hypothetical protein